MVVNLRLQLESYSNDQLLHTLANEQEAPAEVIRLARAIMLERGLSQRNIMDRADALHATKSEVAAMLSGGASATEAVRYLRDKYYLEEKVAVQIVGHINQNDRSLAAFKCLSFFIWGILLFYVIRLVVKML